METGQYFPQDMQKIIFYYVDSQSKENLLLTCKSFLKVAQFFCTEHGSIDDFVNKLYAAPRLSNVFRLLSNHCKEEYKISLINYCYFKGNNHANGKSRDWQEKLHAQVLVKSCEFYKQKQTESEKNEIKSGISLFVKDNPQKKYVKYYIDYCNAMCCIELLKRNSENENEKVFWFNNISLQELMKKHANIGQGIKDIYTCFGQKTVNQYLNKEIVINEEIIKKVVSSKSCAALVFLSECMVLTKETIPGEIEKICDFFDNASTDELRKLLAKSGYTLEFKQLYNKAIASNDFDRAKCYLEIMIDRGDNLMDIEIANIFKFKLDGMLPELFESGLQISKFYIDVLSADQIRQYVEIGYGLYGKDFWSQGNNRYCLHKAICSENVELVKYFLSVETNLDLFIHGGAKPIFYALNNDEIFNLLIEGSSQCFNQLYPYIIEMCLSYDNAEQNIIKLMQKEKNDNAIIAGWFGFAIKKQRNEVFKYLFNRLKLKDEDKTQFLKSAISKKNLDLVKFLLDNNTVSINELSLNISDINENDKEVLDFLLAHKVNIFAISDQYEMILELVNDKSIITCYEEHKQNIAAKQNKKLLLCAIKQKRYDVVKYLLDIENTQLELLLFKDLVTQNKNNDKALRCFLDYAIEKRNVKMVNAVLAHHKDINSLGPCIIDSWHIEAKDIMEIFINYGFNIIHLINEEWPSTARACLNILDTETLVKSLKNGEDVITQQQAFLLLKNVLFHEYLYEWNPLRNEDDKRIEPFIIKAKALFNFIISLKKIDILDVLYDPAALLNESLFLELIDDQAIIDYISSKTDITDLQLQKLLNEAVDYKKCNVVSYLFKEKKFSLEVVKGLRSKDKNMQQILRPYQEKLELPQNKEYEASIDAHIKIIETKRIGDLSLSNKPVNEFSGGFLLLLDDEDKAYYSILFLASQLNVNPQNYYLISKIKAINIAWVDNVYARCSNSPAIMKAMKDLSKINDNLRELTDEEKEARNNLRKIIMDGQGFKSDQCGKYLENIYKIYNRVEADKQLKEDMLCALGKRVLECIHQVNKGVSVGAEGDCIVWDVNKVPSSGSKEEDHFFEMLKVLVKIQNAKQDNSNLSMGYEATKNRYQKEIQPRKTKKLAENNGNVVNNQQNRSFGLSRIKDIISSFFTTIFSILQWLNPFRFVIN